MGTRIIFGRAISSSGYWSRFFCWGDAAVSAGFRAVEGAETFVFLVFASSSPADVENRVPRGHLDHPLQNHWTCCEKPVRWVRVVSTWRRPPRGRSRLNAPWGPVSGSRTRRNEPTARNQY